MEKFHSRLKCRSCGGKTYHQVIAKYRYEFIEGLKSNYIICSCLGCETVQFICEIDRGENFEGGNKIWYFEEKIEVANTYEEKYLFSVPKFLNNIYFQSVHNFNLGYTLMAASGLRMIIEGLFIDLNINKGPVFEDGSTNIKKNKNGEEIFSSKLVNKINQLVYLNILTYEQSLTLQKIRELGNRSLHELVEPSISIIQSALEIIEYIFLSVYELKNYEKNFDREFEQ